MSEKKIIKRKLVVDFTYGEMLNTYSAADLKALAKLWGLKGYSKYKKDELVEAVEVYILEHLEERFSVFNLDHFTVIAELMKGNNVFKQFTVAANELISLGLILEGTVENEMQIVMPRVVSERFVSFYNKYHENFTFNTIIKDYMELMISLYGVVSEEFFVESFYEFNEQSIEKDIIKSSVVYSASRTKNTTYTDGMLHYYRLAEFDAVYKDIQTKDDMAYKVIDHELLHKFVQSGNSLWVDQLKRFDEVVQAHFPDKDAVDLLDELLVMAAYNHGIADYVQLFSKKHESSNMIALKEFADAAITVNIEVPHWELKGFSPFDLSKYNKQMPIVKGDKVGRNDTCPCGSGKKYKKCCMN